MADEQTVQLFQSRDDRGTRSIWATTLADGRLNGRDPGQHLKDAGLELQFWSRVGA